MPPPNGLDSRLRGNDGGCRLNRETVSDGIFALTFKQPAVYQ
ncbi:TPA: hypothetical protein ACFP4U_002016 [Neisseria lactamica]|nr:hypothetical protein [Neisseria lactamica]